LTENEFILEDRKSKIKSVVEKYGEENFYISFSGGKDSTVLSVLVDMALPGNKIPRVYANTGIEYRLILEFVEKEREREHPWELVILKPSVPIKPMLEKEGYPFKSKKHAKKVGTYQRNGMTKTALNYLNPPPDCKTFACPEILRYQFTPEFKLKVDYKCCVNLKEKPLANWGIENKKPYSIVGIMKDEGGSRAKGKCLSFSGNKLKNFHPLIPVTKEWEDWFIKEFNIVICDLYKPPYNFNRTGCKGCPFALKLQEELDTLEKFFPQERKQCEYIWKPVYDEYRRLGYRLRKDDTIEGQMDISDFLGGKNE
jgi:3'-phosphoadenosine 5'-phosphosulfate sulfotransferase (PAPS reductase)/FAD synthetase